MLTKITWAHERACLRYLVIVTTKNESRMCGTRVYIIQTWPLFFRGKWMNQTNHQKNYGIYSEKLGCLIGVYLCAVFGMVIPSIMFIILSCMPLVCLRCNFYTPRYFFLRKCHLMLIKALKTNMKWENSSWVKVVWIQTYK